MKFNEQLHFALSPNWDHTRKLVHEVIRPKLNQQASRIAHMWLAQTAELSGTNYIKDGWGVQRLETGYIAGHCVMVIHLRKEQYVCDNMGFGHHGRCDECRDDHKYTTVTVPADFLNEHGEPL